MGILVHHIIRNKISEIEWMLSKIENVPIVYYLHDFYTCCVNPNLMKNDSESCIDRNIPCNGCCYNQKKYEHLKKIKGFLKTFEDRMTFVAPAEYTRNHWIAFYPEYASKTIVISHQKAIGEYIGNKEAIRDAFSLDSITRFVLYNDNKISSHLWYLSAVLYRSISSVGRSGIGKIFASSF